MIMAWFTLKQSKLAELHIITGEYPPQPGGVSDYTRIIAEDLAASGDEVHVWCPAAIEETPPAAGVTTHRELGRISPADLRRVSRQLNQFAAPRRLLVQWVPHGYGYRSMNLPFCLWLWQRARLRGDHVELMVHEPYIPFSRASWRQSAVAAAHRLMTVILMNCARRVWMSIPAWEARLASYACGRKIPFEWLPIPSNIAVRHDPDGVQTIRARYAANGRMLLGHFGTYGKPIKEMLAEALPALLRERNDLSVLLLGRHSEAFRAELAQSHAEIAARLHATGGLDAVELSKHVSACDLMLQPYPDGISSRRTSAMVSLVHGKPLITTSGLLTEPLWAESEAVALAPATDTKALKEQSHRLLDDVKRREHLSDAAGRLYREHFDVRHIIARLRRAGPLSPSSNASSRAVATDL